MSVRNRTFLFCAAVLLLGVAYSPVHLLGQAATASISGRVTDASGAAIPMATVTVKNTATSASQTAATDDQGRYAIPDLLIGP